MLLEPILVLETDPTLGQGRAPMPDFATLPAFEILNSSLGDDSFRSMTLVPQPPVSAPHAIHSLTTIYSRNERLLNELKSLRFKLNKAQSYLESPSCNRSLALANVLHFKTKHSATLTQLRASRRESHQLLVRLDGGTGPG
jgi:hypothetical protein